MKDSVLYAFIMNVSEGNIDTIQSKYHPLYENLSSFPKKHAITFMKDYIEHNKCSFIPKLKFVKIIRNVSIQYDLKQKTLVEAKKLIDECVLELKLEYSSEYLSITTDKKENPSDNYYDGFY